MTTARAAAVALLLLLAVLGTRAREAVHLDAVGPLNGRGGTLSTALSVAFLVVGLAGLIFVALLSLSTRKRDPTAPRRGRSLVPLVVVIALLLLFRPTLERLTRGVRSPLTAPEPLATPSPSPRPGPAAGGLTSPGSLAALSILAALALLIAVVAVLRLRGRTRPAPPPAPDPSPLADAVTQGRRALGDAGDPRSAIIACYAAMERALAAAGTPPRPADTPTELLHRAAAAGLVHTPAARTLTDLFAEARYSRHPMSPAHHRAAAAALAAISRDLQTPPRRGAPSNPAASPGPATSLGRGPGAAR